MRDDNPMCEFTNNDEIIGGCFLYLFLRGNEMLPKSTLSFGLIRHLMLYYDGRFEKSQYFVHLLYNQQMRHSVIRKVARAGSSETKILKKIGKLLKDDEFKKALANAVEHPEKKESIELNNKILRILSFAGKEMAFSTFERSQSKAKLSSVSIRHGF